MAEFFAVLVILPTLLAGRIVVELGIVVALPFEVLGHISPTFPVSNTTVLVIRADRTTIYAVILFIPAPIPVTGR